MPTGGHPHRDEVYVTTPPDSGRGGITTSARFGRLVNLRYDTWGDGGASTAGIRQRREHAREQHAAGLSGPTADRLPTGATATTTTTTTAAAAATTTTAAATAKRELRWERPVRFRGR